MRSYFRAFKYYAKSDGRATRKEFWLFYLFNFLFLLLFSFLDGVIDALQGGTTLYSLSGYGILTLLYLLAVFIPSLCIQIRRLHDAGKSGYWVLASGVPFLSLYLIYLLLKPSAPDNEYGLGVKEVYSEPLGKPCPACGKHNPIDAVMCDACGYLLSGSVPNKAAKESKESKVVVDNSNMIKTFSGNVDAESSPHLKRTPLPAETGDVAESVQTLGIVNSSCPNCKNSLPADSAFCPFCGTKIERIAETNVAPCLDENKPTSETTVVETISTGESPTAYEQKNIPCAAVPRSIVTTPISNERVNAGFDNSVFNGQFDTRYRNQVTESQHYFDADYGYSPENPMVVSSVKLEGCYLYAFRSLDGKSFEWVRQPKEPGSPIDSYSLYLDGQLYKQIYFNPYGNDSPYLPKGLKVDPDAFEAAKQGISLEEYQYNRMEERNAQETARTRKLKKKKTAKRIVLIFICALLLAGIAFLAFKYGHPYLRYCVANRNFLNGNYEKAIATYTEMGDYRESKAMMIEAKYALATSLYENGDFYEAADIFGEIKDHKDANEMIDECNYGLAMLRMDEENYTAAINILSELDSSKEVKEKMSECYYKFVMQLIKEEEWTDAYNNYNYIIEHKNLNAHGIEDHKYEIYIGYAKEQNSLETESAYSNAFQALDELSESYDTVELTSLRELTAERLNSAIYDAGLKLMAEFGYKDAVDKFEQILDYRDSRNLWLEAMYQHIGEGNTKLGESESRLWKILYKRETMISYAKILAENNYKDGKSLYKDLIAWNVTITMNNDKNDASVVVDSISKYDNMCAHVTVSGGPIDETVELKYVFTMPNGNVLSDTWDFEFLDGYSAVAWCYYNDPQYGSIGTCYVKIYNNSTGELLGSASIRVTG